MKESEKPAEFTIDNLETLSIKNNWCSWCVNVFVSDQTGEWNSYGTGLLSFYGKKKQQTTLTKLTSVKELKTDQDVWDQNMFTMQVKSNKNLTANNRELRLDSELKKKISMNGGDDLILHVELKKAVQCNLADLVIMWYQEDIGEHLALSFLSAVAIIESWEIICKITGTELQDTFKIQVEYLDYILSNLQSKEDELIKKKLTVAVFCSKLDSIKQLVNIYKSVKPQDSNYKEVTSKIHKITMILLEEWQLDILLHVLSDDVFYDMLDLFRDMHSEKASTVNYREFFVNQTHFINSFDFPPQMVDIIKMRYKIMFLKDYIFCDHQKEEFLSYLNSILEIPSSSIFLHLTENNSLFLKLLDMMDEKSEQFFNEFFAIYKPLSSDSKSLFAVTFFMKGIHLAYLKKSYEYLSQKDPDRHKILNLIEMLGVIVMSKKENSVKLFNTKVEVGDLKVTFSTVLNLMLADPLEKIQDCALNILSTMTDIVLTDRTTNISLLNSYLVPEMAEYILKTPEHLLTWRYFYSYIRMLTLCIDKENSTGSSNSFMITNLVNYKTLTALPAVYQKHRRNKSFVVNFLQFVNALLTINDETIVKQVIDNGYLFFVWQCFTVSLKRNNLLLSICLKIFTVIEKSKTTAFLLYFGETFGKEIQVKSYEVNSAVRGLMQAYRILIQDPTKPKDVDGQFSEASAQAESSDREDASRKLVQGSSKEFSIISSKNEKVIAGMDEILQDEDREVTIIEKPSRPVKIPLIPLGESPLEEGTLGKRDNIPDKSL